MIDSFYDCSFCDELEGNETAFNLYNSLLKDSFPKGRIFYKDLCWHMMPTLGCFIEGYILCVNNTHTQSLYHSRDDHICDLTKKIRIIKTMYSEVYNSDFLFFEHGIVDGHYRSACCVDHTHIHFLPYDISLWNSLNRRFNFNFFKLHEISDIKKVIDKYAIKSYLLFGDVDSRIYLIDASNTTYPSQFFRQVIYDKLFIDKGGWDWRRFYEIDKMLITYNKFQNYFNGHKKC